MEKKRLKVNAAVCDARNVTETVLESYKGVDINAAVVLVSGETKELMSRYDMNINTAEVIEISPDTEFMIQNGTYEISDNTILPKPTVLMVNGTLDIKTNAQEVLDKCISIHVNGTVSYPSDIRGHLPIIKVNGTTECYPSDAVKLKHKLMMDETFIMRAKSSKYYVRNKVVIPDGKLDISPLLDNGAEFITKRAIIAEELLENALSLFSEDVEIDTIPEGYKYINSEVLRDTLIRKYGDRIYIDGDLIIDLESEKALDKITNLKVNGTVYIFEQLEDRFFRINPEYKDVQKIKGTIIEDEAIVTIDKKQIQKEGMTILDCGVVNIGEDITPDEIKEKLQLIGCGYVSCNKDQKSALQSISEDVGYIDGGGTKKIDTLEDLFDKNIKVINAASYIL